jgi:HSP20 family protein
MDGFSDRLKDLYDSIARRAFEIFQSRGRADGNDLDDWFRAEAEYFHTMHLDLSESEDALLVHAEVPGFRANDLTVGVEPRRVTITGKRQNGVFSKARKILHRDGCADEIFRVLWLPVGVDPQKATATLKDGILELTMPKAALAARPLVQAKTDWIVRATDYRVWEESFTRLLELGD